MRKKPCPSSATTAPPRADLPSFVTPVLLIEDRRTNIYYVAADPRDVDALNAAGHFADRGIVIPVKTGSRASWMTPGGVRRALAAARRHSLESENDDRRVQKSTFSTDDVLPLLISRAGRVLHPSSHAEYVAASSFLSLTNKLPIAVWKSIFSRQKFL